MNEKKDTKGILYKGKQYNLGWGGGEGLLPKNNA